MTTEEVAVPRLQDEGPANQIVDDAILPGSKLDLLHSYCVRGWRIMPCRGKVPLIPDWPNVASADWNQVRRWYDEFPECNWGWALDRHMVLDVDPRNGFSLSDLDNWEGLFGFSLPQTLIQRTGGGGLHLVLEMPDGVTVKSGKVYFNGRAVPGLDIKGRGGQIIIEPSGHESGGRYHWMDPGQTVHAVPSDLLRCLNQVSRNGDNTGGERLDLGEIYEGLSEGERDEGLFKYASSLRARNPRMTREEAYALVEHWGRACTPPFPDEWCRRKVDQAWKYAPGTSDDVDLSRYTNFIKSLSVTETSAEPTPAARTERLVDGFNFIFGEPDNIPAVWGVGENILWSEGEGVMLVGHQGVGKTTIAQQAVLHRIGVRDGDLLGLSLAHDDRPVLYLAMDRPRQAARSFRRMVEHGNREPLQRLLRVWRGPLPVNILSSSAVLADFVQEVCPGAGTLVIDSVKDLAPGINKDEVGAAINSAWQEVIARDIQLMTIHHQRKAQNGASRTNTLDDVYGSTWLTSGLGSVIVIDGEPGDTTVELRHLKQPASPVGPVRVRHDHSIGRSIIFEGDTEILALLNAAGPEGLTVVQIAQALYGRTTSSDQQKVRRKLNKYVNDHVIIQVKGQLTPTAGKTPDRFRAIFHFDQG